MHAIAKMNTPPERKHLPKREAAQHALRELKKELSNMTDAERAYLEDLSSDDDDYAPPRRVERPGCPVPNRSFSRRKGRGGG